jgi:deoxyhypusine synthase
LKDAAQAYSQHLAKGGQMFLSMAGAMSTAEIGVSLAEMIRQGKIHAICCTGANLEEDIFNLVAHDHYVRLPDYRSLSPQEEMQLLKRNLHRVTDTCIPEEEAMVRIDDLIVREWQAADAQGERLFPYEFFYRLLRSEKLKQFYEIDPQDSWLLAAAEKDLPIFTPGWEDSTLGNAYAACCTLGKIRNVHTVRSGVEAMMQLIEWYERVSQQYSLGFFQIGGGIAGDFAICVVPLLRQDLQRPKVPCWGYFCQISDSTTSYGSYSGAVPNEKITWDKLEVDTPRFIIESDATIVAPLIFGWVLGW